MRDTIDSLAILALVAVAATAWGAPPTADSFALRAGRILPVAPDLPPEISDGVIVVHQGQIAAIGREGEVDIPPDLAVIAFPDATVTPGLVAAASTFGGRHRGDWSVAAGYQAVDAFDRYGNYAVTLAAGVTTVHVNPGTHRLLTGQGAVVKLGGPPPERILQARADLAINLGPDVLDPPPHVTYPFPASADVPIQPPRQQRPASRLGQLLALDEAIRDALAGRPSEPYSVHGPALARAWKEERPLRFGADRAVDLLAAIAFLRRHERRGYLVGGAEVDRVAQALRTADVPLVYRPQARLAEPGGDLGTDPAALSTETCNFAALEGVELALAPDDAKHLRLAAVRAAGRGLARGRALAAITRVPAEILAVDDRVGSLAVGKDADLLVLSGDPLAVSAHVQRVYIQGRCVFQPPTDAPLVVRASMVWAGPGKWIPDGQILVEDDKIVAVGRSVPHPPFARVIDVRPGGFVTPGFIDAFGHLGLAGDRTAVTSDMRLSKLFGAADVTDARVAAAGVTTVVVAPYALSNTKGAACAVVKTAGRRRNRRMLRDPAAVLFDLRRTDPLAAAETLEKAITAGQKYLDSWTKYEKDLKAFQDKKTKTKSPAENSPQKDEDTEKDAEKKEPAKDDDRPKPPKVDPSLEPLKALLQKKIPAVVQVSSAAQIRETVAALVDKHKLPVVLVGAEQAASLAEMLVDKKVTVVVPPRVVRKRRYREYHQADDLNRRGVPIAFQSNAEDGARHLPTVVLYAVERGLDAEAALAALTVGAAKALKIDDRVGTLEAGKDADLVIFNSDPFQQAGRVLRVIVDGREVRP